MDPEKYIGKHISALPTPAFIVSLTKVKKNCDTMRNRFLDVGVRLRPHMKTHKTIEAALLQTGGTKTGIVVSTVAEALFFAQNGFDDIVLARPATPYLMKRCQDCLELKSKNVKFLVNSVEGATAVVQAASEHNPVQVLLKISAGYERAGILWDDDRLIVGIVKKLHESAETNVKFCGIYAHCGNSYTPNSLLKTSIRDETIARIRHVKDTLATNGFPCIEAGVGSTPTCSLPPSPAVAHLTEVHPGNYVFYDVQQESYGSCSRSDIAVRVLTRVLSHRPSTRQIIVDMGFTALTKQGLDQAVPGYAAIDGYPNYKLSEMSQEIGKIEKIDGSAIDYAEFPLDKVLCVFPYHACASAGVHQYYYVHDDDEIVREIWHPVRGW